MCNYADVLRLLHTAKVISTLSSVEPRSASTKERFQENQFMYVFYSNANVCLSYELHMILLL